MGNVHPTSERLSKKFLIDDERCVFCLNNMETIVHLFKDCPVTASFLLHNPLGLRARDYPDMSLTD